jgi:hypothetical protein
MVFVAFVNKRSTHDAAGASVTCSLASSEADAQQVACHDDLALIVLPYYSLVSWKIG